ncbi:RagB/SusD family nutrient uptake outer membrane protein [uncultured Polaribacter sp.]|uniref:RagB/SusD family nutrient uptake outer membrane protein n=1 Tax=uncultured Polaribacter sp. TaxID=174711 RepID=UPI002632476B|nr:RagB/SusD family nutrient uptake outer membrane protein [uncultured Polaribacter sp.]
MKFLKNKTRAFILLLLTITYIGCDNYLKEELYNSVAIENFIDENNADQLVVSIYAQLRSVYKNYNYQFLGTDLFTVKSELFNTNPQNDYFAYTASESDGYWNANYNVIAKANTAINRYENQINWSDGRLNERAYGIAQAKALRGLAFFNLVQQFGGVVLSTEEPLTIRTDYTRSTEQESYEFIIIDLEAAIPNLVDDPQTGRFSRRAAQHLLAKVYLTRGYKSYAESSDFSTAAALAETAIGNYDIRSQSFEEVFDFDNQVNPEILFAIQWGASGVASDKNNTKHSLFMTSVFEYPGVSRNNQYGGIGSSGMPTPYFYSLFTENDTRENATIHRTIIADETSMIGTDNIIPGDTLVYYPKNTLDNEELIDRLNRYWVYQPDQYLFGRPDDISGVNYLYSRNPLLVNFPYFKKFDDEDINAEGEGSRDTFVFRVAGTHLIAAEAHLGAGNIAQALFHINRVRERATGVSNEYKTVTIDNILNERAMELAGEVNRWTTLKRTGKLLERIEMYNPHYRDHGAFDPNIHYLRPIPINELVISPNTMTQNPGY